MTSPSEAVSAAPKLETRLARGGRRLVLVGLRRRTFDDLYHQLLNASWPRLVALIFGSYIFANVVFACGYLALGDAIENAERGSFADAFFFSVQTMATIGYGKMVPRTHAANAIVTVEAIAGLLGFAMSTSLLFAKFARPTARVMFSEWAIVAQRDGTRSLMFRMANERANQIAEAQLRVVLARDETTVEGERVRRFHDLVLSRDRTAVFALTWTAIHPITKDSPLHGATIESLRACEAEIIASVTGLDETFSQTIHARHAYTPDHVAFGARFVDVISRHPDGSRRIDYTKFHDIVRTEG